MAALNTRHRRGERGHVLLITAVMGLWVTAWRATHDAIRTERFVVRRGIRAHSVQQALARGLALLQTGRPPTDPYACLVTLTHDGASWDCVVGFESQGNPNDWSVDVRLALEDEASGLPGMPASFGS
jgi:hypothetical protein